MSRSVLQVFANYQAARTSFVQTVAELAHRPQNIETLQNAGVMALLRPLLLDSVPSIQQSAALALGRLANYSEALAEAVIQNEVLPQLVYSLNEQNRFYKKTAAFVLKSVAKHSPELAISVVEAGALDALVGCLAEFEPSVKEAAAWALGYIARHTPELAQAVVDASSVPQLVLCLQEPELSLKRIAASTLSEICKHSPELAQIVVDAGAVPYLAPMITHPDAKLKRQVCACLSQVAKHSIDLAEVVVEAEVCPKIFLCLKDQDHIVRRNAATCIREIARHTPELAHLIVNAGGHGAIIEYITNVRGGARLPGIMTLGYIASMSETLALAIVVSQGIPPLKDALVSEKDDNEKAAAAWSLGQIGKHSPDHAKMLAQANVFPLLIDIYRNENYSPDLHQKVQKTLKMVLQKCTHLPALEPLLEDCPDKILKYVVHQFAKVLPNNPAARKSFVQSRGLAKIQELKSDDKSKFQEYIATINSCYPREIVEYYSPNYSETLLKKLEEYEGPRS
jgi:3-methyladenine DNA glycosylase AlkD